MAVTIIATAMASNANSYCTLAEANDYFETKYHNDTWNNASDDVKRACLIWATRLLDQHYVWDGYKYTDTQALRWPRSGVYDMDGFDIDYQTIPQFLKNATAEYAEFLIANDRTAEQDTRGYKKMKVGSLELTIDKNDRIDAVPDPVDEILKSYGRKRSRRNTKVVRV